MKDHDTYCQFSWQLVVSTKFLQLISVVHALSDIITYSLCVMFTLNGTTYNWENQAKIFDSLA